MGDVSFIGAIPGLRTRTWWKALVALAVYWLALSLVFTGNPADAFSGLFVLTAWILATDGWGLRQRVPGVRSSSRGTATIAWAAFVLGGLLVGGALAGTRVAGTPTTQTGAASTILVLLLVAGGVVVLLRIFGDRSTGAGYHPRTLANLEALYDPGEATLYLSDWNVLSPASAARWDPKRGRFVMVRERGKSRVTAETATLALTPDHLYFVQFGSWGGYCGGFGSGAREVKWFKAVPLRQITRWSFESMKTTKGALTGHRLLFESHSGDWVRNFGALWWAPPVSAEPFIQQFKAAIGRVATAGAATSVDLASQLRALSALVDEGVITKADMERAKDLYLGRAPDQRQVMERSLRSLHDLRRTGVLSEVEFEIKKRDILATTR